MGAFKYLGAKVDLGGDLECELNGSINSASKANLEFFVGKERNLNGEYISGLSECIDLEI